MKRLNTILAKALILFSLLLPWSASEALENFERAGIISTLSYDSFKIRDQTYRLSAIAKVIIPGTDKAKLNDFKRGDRIWVKGRILGSVYYVDTLFCLPAITNE